MVGTEKTCVTLQPTFPAVFTSKYDEMLLLRSTFFFLH